MGAHLEADTRAVVTCRNVSGEVVARDATAEQTEEILAAAGSSRRIRAFVLDPT